MPKDITPPIPLNRWFRDLKSVEQLRVTLENEGFKQAVAILKETAGPSYASLQNTEVDSRRLAWYAGYRDAFNDLEKLTKLPESGTSSINNNNEWTHIE